MFISLSIVVSGFGNLTPNTRLRQCMRIKFCLISIPLTILARSAGKLMGCGIRFIYLEACLFKNDPPKNEKGKVSFCAVSLMIALFLLASTCSVFMEDWSYVESLYACFTTFTTIAFGDYIHLDPFARKVAGGEIADYLVVLYGLISCFPYIMGLSLVSCILGCLFDSVENVRSFSDRCTKFLQNLPWLVLRCLCRERSGYARDLQGKRVNPPYRPSN